MNKQIIHQNSQKGTIQNENLRNPKIMNNKIFTKIIKKEKYKTRIHEISRF